MSLSLNNIVPVTIEVAATPQAARNFGIGLVLTTAATVPVAGRVQTFTTYAELVVAFPSDTALQHFAAAYFDDSYRSPPTSLKVGVQATADGNATVALTACQDADPTFYGVACIPGTALADEKLAAAWCAANQCRFFACSQDATVFDGTESSANLIWYLGESVPTARAMTIATYTVGDPNAVAHAAMMALYMTVDYTQPNSIRTGMFKSLGGIGPTSFTQTQLLRITGAFDGSAPGWNGNVYATFGTTNMLARGQAADGRFEDEGIALDWLQSNLQVGVFNVMQQTSGKIPATDLGTQMLIDGMIPTLNLARSNGLCAPGYWTFQPVGNVATGDFLPDGYYVYGAPVSSQSAADRAARKAPPITVIMCGAGALQYCAPTVIFQR